MIQVGCVFAFVNLSVKKSAYYILVGRSKLHVNCYGNFANNYELCFYENLMSNTIDTYAEEPIEMAL